VERAHPSWHDAGVPRSCCASDRLDIFDERAARRALRRYLAHGLGGSDALQIAAWAEEGSLDGASVVEVGGGIGQIQADLVRRGAATGRIVELVPEYEGPAAELAAAAAVADRSSFQLADLLAEPEAVEEADVVVLRRVVCCTPDGPALLAAAAGKARRTLLASYPRDRFLVRAAVRIENLAFAVLRKRFRSFAHSPAELEQAVARRGLTRTRLSRSFAWETAQFDHAPTS
jgi:magnesium-protoporphyrin O-methyltransferase